MAEPDDENETGGAPGSGNGGEPDAAIIWYILGLFAGLFLMGKISVSRGLSGKPMSTTTSLLVVALFLAPMFLLGSISKHLSSEASKGNISWATYWTTMFGITISMLALLGITGIDDVIELFKTWSAQDK
ncbi:hypothetical protein [Kitasatospora sp. NPDC093806]|uniref:hypothetical protein n=1 Tax=Kitasatospora sp. NPDC093806 TaxID=3155075 RepID=UPI0034295EE6